MIYDPTLKNIQILSSLLSHGEVVVFPTETVYGLGANATLDQAVARIFALKSRPSFNPLIVHCSSLERAQEYGIFNPLALRLARQFWPGPLTLIVGKTKDCKISPLVTAGLSTVALRIPDHPIALDLLRTLPFPLAAPSANISGRLSPTTAQHVASMFGSDLRILDGGPCQHGLESTIIEVSTDTPYLLRLGSLPKESLEKTLGQPLTLKTKVKEGEAPLSPGQLLRHYAPLHPVRINVTEVYPQEALLAFGPTGSKGAPYVTLNISPTGSLEEAAHNFYAMLHALDEIKDISSIAIQPIPQAGLGIALNDRLQRIQTS